MTKKLTPQEAWEHAKALSSDLSHIEKRGDVYCAVVRVAGYQWLEFVEIDWPEGVTQWPPPVAENNYMLEALRSALNVLDKGFQVRIQDQWPALKAILPETIQKVKDAIERAEAENIPAQAQKTVDAGHHYVKYPVQENVGTSEQAPTESLVSQFIKLRYPYVDYETAMNMAGGDLLKDMKVWQQLLQHPADREPTDEEVERACRLYYHGFSVPAEMLVVRNILKAWQQVWRSAQ